MRCAASLVTIGSPATANPLDALRQIIDARQSAPVMPLYHEFIGREYWKESDMERALAEPRLTDEGVYFRVANGEAERECLVSKNALAYLCRRQGHAMDFMNTYRACEARIQSVARRLVSAGESASPLVLGAAYFVDGRGG